jgi:hypothetical protein
VGVLVLLCHDLVDVFLEAAKLAKYAGRQVYMLCKLLFLFRQIVSIVDS